MARFDVYQSRISDDPPLLVQIQADFHDYLDSRVIIPLRTYKSAKEEYKRHMTPEITVKGVRYLLMTADMGAVSVHHLGKKVASLSDKHYEITSAVDFLMQGF